jgi:hypothetical protein
VANPGARELPNDITTQFQRVDVFSAILEESTGSLG